MRRSLVLFAVLFSSVLGLAVPAVATGPPGSLTGSLEGDLSKTPPGGNRPITVRPNTGSSDQGSVVTPMATPGVSYTCNNAGTLRRRANSFVLGWCTAGMHIDISSTVITQGWQGGFGEGGYANCGWFLLANGLTQGGAFDHNCGNTTFAESYFAQNVNVSPADDGAAVPILRSDCSIWLNVKPWSSTASPSTTFNTLNPATDTFRYRYRTKSDYVLGHWLRNGADTYYNWGFVRNTCVGDPATRVPSTSVPAP